MNSRYFNEGALAGLEAMTEDAQKRGTFDALATIGPAVMGRLSGSTSDTDYSDGFRRGISLGAELRVARAHETIMLRD